MRRLTVPVVISLFLFFTFIVGAVHASGNTSSTVTTSEPTSATLIADSPAQFSLHPVRRPNGQKWRFGYVDSGDYSEYPRTLRGIVKGLEELGWLSVPEAPPSLDSAQLWEFLAEHTRSDYIEFVRDAWWQPANADAKQRPALRHAIMNRISTIGDIDLIIAMGTWAGQDMALLKAPVPTIVASTSDPISAHIIASTNDSGLDNLHARVDPERYQRQVQLFHDIIPFKRLGLVYEDTDEGKMYTGLKAVEDIAQKAGFTIHSCHAAWNGVTLETATENTLNCYRRLAPDIDAAYVTVHRGITAESVKTIAEILSNANVPSFSMLGSSEVQLGILLGLAQADASYLGMFYAKTIAKILNGALARQLNQIWSDPAKLAINLETARSIGFDPPVDALLAADEIFPEPLIDQN